MAWQVLQVFQAEGSELGGRPWSLFQHQMCIKKWKKSGIGVINAIQLPAAQSYGTVSVSAFGGAAKAAKRSLAFLDMWQATTGTWVDATRLSNRVRAQPSSSQRAATAMYGKRFVAWRVLTGYGARYDLKNYTITVPYRVFIGGDGAALPRTAKSLRHTPLKNLRGPLESDAAVRSTHFYE